MITRIPVFGVLVLAAAVLSGCTQANPTDTLARAEAAPQASHPELEFFNGISATLEIEMSSPPENIGDTANQRALPTATIKSLALKAQVVEGDPPKGRELTGKELQGVAFQGATIQLRGEGGVTVTHQAANGQAFTVQELLKAVEDTERQSRPSSEWFGGVDMHHVYFEGIAEGEDGVWDIQWGS
jgi:hypothetical protein